MFQIYGYDPLEALQIFLDSRLFLAFFAILLNICVDLINRFVQHALSQSSDSDEKQRLANFYRIDNWKNKKQLFNPQAINVRASWGKRISQQPPKPRMPLKSGANFLEMAVRGLANPMISMAVFFFGPKTAVLKLPFELPPILCSILQISMNPQNATSSDVSFYSFFIITQHIGHVFVEWIPVIRKAPKTLQTIGPIENTVNDLLMKETKWELDTAEEELGSFLDKEIKKKQ